MVQICPKCESTDISPDFDNAAAVYTGLFNNMYVCNACGHSGGFFPEVDEKDLKKLKKKLPSKKKNAKKK